MKLTNGKEGCDICGACFTCGTPKRVFENQVLCPRCFTKKTKK